MLKRTKHLTELNRAGSQDQSHHARTSKLGGADVYRDVWAVRVLVGRHEAQAPLRQIHGADVRSSWPQVPRAARACKFFVERTEADRGA